MKININRNEFLTPLQQISGVVEAKQTLAILTNLLININDNELKITGTDLEVEVVSSVKSTNSDNGNITLPAKKLLDICKSLPDNSVIDINIEGDRATLKSGKSKFILSTLPADNFPNVGKLKSDDGVEPLVINISQQKLKKLFQKTQFCMAVQDIRFFLNGLLLEVEESKVRTVATDGHRLATAEVECKNNINTEECKQVIVPRKAITELVRVLNDSDENVSITLTDKHARFEFSEIIFTTKLIDDTYPDYKRVIPQGGDKILTVGKDIINQSLTRSAILLTDKLRSVRWNISENLLKISSNNKEQDEADDEVIVDYKASDLEINFNVVYLLDAVSAVDSEQIEIVMLDSGSSIIIKPTETETSEEIEYLFVVMPMLI